MISILFMVSDILNTAVFKKRLALVLGESRSNLVLRQLRKETLKIDERDPVECRVRQVIRVADEIRDFSWMVQDRLKHVIRNAPRKTEECVTILV